jgi:hypothetical protein
MSWKIWVFIPGRSKTFFLQNFQTVSGAHSTSYLMNARVYLTRGKADEG